MGADAKAQHRVLCLYGVVYPLHQGRHRGPPPVVQGLSPAVGCIVLGVDPGLGSGVKIIVKMDAVHGVMVQQLGDALHHKVRHLPI